MNLEKKPPNQSGACLRILLIGLLAMRAPPAFTEDRATLEQAISERENGRAYKALAVLDSLRQADPDSSRLKLETALILIQLKDYAGAQTLLNEVLSDPNLPTNVRINTQLLLLKVSRLRQQRTDRRLDVSLMLGLGYSRVADTDPLLVDGGIRVRQNTDLPNLNLAGYPVSNTWVKQAGANFFYAPGGETDEIIFEGSTLLRMALHDVSLQPGLGLRWLQENPEPSISLSSGWSPAPGVELTGHAERRWPGDTKPGNRYRARLGLFTDRPWQVRLGYKNRPAADNEGRRSDWLDMAVLHEGFGNPTLGVQQRLGGSGAGSEFQTKVYLKGDWTVPGGFSLLSELQYLDYAGPDEGWYGRWGLLWRK